MDCNVIATGIVAAVEERVETPARRPARGNNVAPARKPGRIRRGDHQRRHDVRRGAEDCEGRRQMTN